MSIARLVCCQLEALMFSELMAERVAGETLEDLFSSLVPHERFGILVPCCSPRRDVSGELFDAAVGRALELLGGECREPSLHEIHPRPVGRCEVEVEPSMAKQPAVDLRSL